jgi:hypothetical protein
MMKLGIYENSLLVRVFASPLICNNSYGPGDGFIYFIRSALGKSTIRRLGLTHMSDAWKEHMLAHYEFKKPARRPRRAQQIVDQG